MFEEKRNKKVKIPMKIIKIYIHIKKENKNEQKYIKLHA